MGSSSLLLRLPPLLAAVEVLKKLLRCPPCPPRVPQPHPHEDGREHLAQRHLLLQACSRRSPLAIAAAVGSFSSASRPWREQSASEREGGDQREKKQKQSEGGENATLMTQNTDGTRDIHGMINTSLASYHNTLLH
eukprot:768693-Hanusia_phi.AAC.1